LSGQFQLVARIEREMLSGTECDRPTGIQSALPNLKPRHGVRLNCLETALTLLHWSKRAATDESQFRWANASALKKPFGVERWGIIELGSDAGAG